MTSNYEHRAFKINCMDYDLECEDGKWWWSCGNATDNKLHGSFVEALQAAMNHASHIEAEYSAEWDVMADIREQQRKEERTFGRLGWAA